MCVCVWVRVYVCECVCVVTLEWSRTTLIWAGRSEQTRVPLGLILRVSVVGTKRGSKPLPSRSSLMCDPGMLREMTI